MSSSDVEVLIVESHPLLRFGLLGCLDRGEGIARVDTVATLADAWAHPAIGESDVVLLDAGQPNAAAFIADLREFVEAKIIVIGTESERELLLAGLAAGADAALDQDVLTPVSLALAIRSTLAGGRFVMPEAEPVHIEETVSPRLSEREQHVLALVADGLPTREVALEMSYSERTVKKVLGDVVVKLGARSRSQAIACAVRQGII